MIFYLAKGGGMDSPANASVVKAYSLHAPFYDVWARLAESRAGERALEFAALANGESLLEVAVGTGRILARILGRVRLGRVAAVDLSPAMMRRARKRLDSTPGGRGVLSRADAARLPFAHATFDVLLNCYMLDLLEEGKSGEVLLEFARVLKPGGRLVLVNMATPEKWLNAGWMWLYLRAPIVVGGCRPVPAGNYLAEGGWQVLRSDLVSQNGFRSELFLAKPPRIVPAP